MSLLVVEGVAHPGRSRDELLGCAIDTPQPGQERDAYGMIVEGWVAGRHGPTVSVELVSRGVVLARVPVCVPRRDIGDLFPDQEWAGRCGFRVGLGSVRLPAAFCLEVRAVLEGERRVPFGAVTGTRRLPAVDSSSIQPLMVTTLGRTGSTWVTRLLGVHPSIQTYRPFEYEARLASYWVEVLGALADPMSYTQALRGELYGDDWWLGRRRRSPLPPPRPDDPTEEWLDRRHVEELVPFCAAQIDAFYRRAGDEEEKTPRFFAEKFAPGSFVPEALWSLYPGAREIVLVRDFRDMTCSILAYNRKRGYDGFGRDQAASDIEYVHRLRTDASRMLDRWRERSDDAFLLRYEDLILAPEQTLGQVMAYLGVASDEDTIEGILARARSLTPDAQSQHSTSASAGDSVGRWRSEMEPAMQEASQEAFSDLLSAFGYES